MSHRLIVLSNFNITVKY